MVSSRSFPDLERAPGKKDNWVEAAGELPDYIERIAKQLHYTQGYTISRAIATAINTVKRWSKGGTVTKSGTTKRITPATQAKAAKAVAEWNALRAKSKARKTANMAYSSEGERTTANMAISSKVLTTPRTKNHKTVSYATGPSQNARASAQSKGQAFQDGRFPIRNVSDLQKAIRAFGRAKDEDKPALKRFIMRRARALGRSDLIPQSWSKAEMARVEGLLIELAGKRGPYQRHVEHTKQHGRKKGDLSRKADWAHGYKPKTPVAMAVKAKRIDADELSSTGKAQPEDQKELSKPIPPHLQKFTPDARDVRPEGKDQVRSEDTKESKKSSTTTSRAALQRRRNRLERKKRDGTLTSAEQRQLNQLTKQLSARRG